MNPLHPDSAEQEHQPRFDDAIPTASDRTLPLVALGGSAGSIPALTTFFSLVPPDFGMAFVVVLHLAPERESHLAEVIQRVTSLPVRQVTGPEPVRADHVYVIPPGKSLDMIDGELRLQELQSLSGRHVAVDLFFRALADACGPHAAAIVLSGMDGDGAIGIRRIKERGGLTIAQDPLEAEHTGMPRSAIATGLVDWVLPVADMPARLAAYYRIERDLKLPAAERAVEQGTAPSDPDEVMLRRVLELLRERTGHDFSAYKRGTIVRRLGRRMQVVEVHTLAEYLAHLQKHLGEGQALLKDLLVSVTNFFRDPALFDALVPLMPRLFERKGRADTVRVWVAGCATGEEAYSMAMLLHEHARGLDDPPRLLVFATDLDEDAISIGRRGFYPSTIAADVSPERLERFFTPEGDGYQVRAELRETVLFAVHNLLTDAPISRVDAVSCRNLLIYLERSAQRQLTEVFHFALRPAGLLLLGASESIEEASPLFGVLDKRRRIYVRRPVPRLALPLPLELTTALSDPVPLTGVPQRSASVGAEAVLADRSKRFEPPSGDAIAGKAAVARLSRIHSDLMARFAMPSVIVNAQDQLVHLSSKAGRFLRFIGGEPSRDLLQLVHPDLRGGLRVALRQAAESGSSSEVLGLPAEIDGMPMLVDITVAPADEVAPQCQLVVFKALPANRRDALAAAADPDAIERERALGEQLAGMKAHLRDVVEQYEASSEELRASNEELRAMNEGLRSMTDELELRRQEAQSMNEELTAVSAEAKRAAQEVGATNRDLHGLMESMSIAMIFLDRDLHITFYTPMAVGLFHLIPTDVGRPLSDLVQRFDDPALLADAQRVLDRLVPIEREVSAAPRWFLARMQPYRTLDERIAGVVLTFTDITERRLQQVGERAAAQELEQRCAQLEAMLSALPDAVCAFDAGRRLAYANAAARRMLSLTEEDPYAAPSLPELGRRVPLAAALDRELQRALTSASQPAPGARDGMLLAGDAERRVVCGFQPIAATESAPPMMLVWLRETARVQPAPSAQQR